MAATIKTRIVKIGNSHGIRIPKLLLEQVGLEGEVELEAQVDQLIVRPVAPARRGWDEQFQAMAAHGDDRLLDGDIPLPTAWDEREWEW
jgi:antitoxin MazE